jgi:hypothetical protein
MLLKPIAVASQSKAWVYGRSMAGIAGSYPSGTLLSVSCDCLVLSELSATSRLLVQSSRTEGGVSECNLVTSYRRPWTTIAIKPCEFY